MTYTIDTFWKRRLAVIQPDGGTLLGWEVVDKEPKAFTEAPLTVSVEFEDSGDPDTSSVILVSAPGAVGKSTLARKIASETGAVYVDLAKADPVGGYTLSGGLVKFEIYESWKNDSAALLIDGLDEARLRVTQQGFEAFLRDVAEQSAGRQIPTVLFGRTGAVQDAWPTLANESNKPAVLEIGYYDLKGSVDFAMDEIGKEGGLSDHRQVQRQATELLLKRLREDTEADGDRFAGYAPVLQAVAKRVASENNPSLLVAEINRGDQPATLRNVVDAILKREKSKLAGLAFDDKGLKESLYGPQEQLDRLLARVYGTQPPKLPPMSPQDTKLYDDVLKTWVEEHPFLLGGASGTSSAVFEAIVAVKALQQRSQASGIALERELEKGSAANPFLSEFYLSSAEEGTQYLPLEHIGVVYASVRAGLSLGDSAELRVEGNVEEGDDDEDALGAEIEITVHRTNGGRERPWRFDTDQGETLKFGALVKDAHVSLWLSDVEICAGSEMILVAPIDIQCDKLRLRGEKLVVEKASESKYSTVSLESTSCLAPMVTSVPALRGDVSLTVSWPGAQHYPWTGFATRLSSIDDSPRVGEGLRRFRKIVGAFQSGGRGELARYVDKIEHARMMKGEGQRVLYHLRSTGIISRKGLMYYLDPDALAEVTGATYRNCSSWNFSPRTIAFVRDLVAAGPGSDAPVLPER